MAHGQASSGAVDRTLCNTITAKGFKHQLMKSRLASVASASAVCSNVASKGKVILPSVPSTNNCKQFRPLQPTKPAPFQFATDGRIKQDVHPSGTGTVRDNPVIGSCDPVNFHKMLRTYQIPAGTTTSSTTRPQPFRASASTEATERRARHKSAEPSPRPSTTNRFAQQHNISNASSSSVFSQGRTRQVSGGDSYLSMAEQVLKFQTGTPDRFRSRPKRRSMSTPSSCAKSNRGRSPSPLHCTQAQTPNLVTRGRARKPTVLSSVQKELLELEDAKQNRFRARAVGEGVPKSSQQNATVERRMPTQPEPFNLTSGLSRPRSQVEEKKEEFHAYPFNRKIFDGPIGIPARNPLPVVVPESPAFALKERLKGNIYFRASNTPPHNF